MLLYAHDSYSIICFSIYIYIYIYIIYIYIYIFVFQRYVYIYIYIREERVLRADPGVGAASSQDVIKIYKNGNRLDNIYWFFTPG